MKSWNMDEKLKHAGRKLATARQKHLYQLGAHELHEHAWRALLVGGRSTDFPGHNDFIENGQRKGMFLGYDVAPTRLSLATRDGADV